MQRPDVAACIREVRERLAAQPQADAAGLPMDGNTRTMTIGHRSVQMQTALEPVRQAIASATLADLGYSASGTERPPEALRMTVRNLATLDVMAETFWTWIETQGVMTAKGKTRSAVTTLLSIMERQNKLALALGLERRGKTVKGLTADQYAAVQESAR